MRQPIRKKKPSWRTRALNAERAAREMRKQMLASSLESHNKVVAAKAHAWDVRQETSGRTRDYNRLVTACIGIAKMPPRSQRAVAAVRAALKMVSINVP